MIWHSKPFLSLENIFYMFYWLNSGKYIWTNIKGWENYSSLRYRWDPSLMRKPLPCFPHFMPPCHWLSFIIIDWLSLSIIDEYWSSLIIIDYHWLSLIIIDYHWWYKTWKTMTHWLSDWQLEKVPLMLNMSFVWEKSRI